MYKSKDVRVRRGECERVRVKRNKNWGIGMHVVSVALRVPVRASGEVSMTVLQAILKLDFVMNVMGSH